MNVFSKVPLEQFKIDFNNVACPLKEEYIQEIYNDIKVPTRATMGSAGYDFFSPVNFTILPNETITIPTGICWKTDYETLVLQIYPRSGLGFKYQCNLANGTGIIDSDYWKSDNYGHVMIKLVNRGNKEMTVEKGKAFAQGILTQCFVVDDDNTLETRNGGFGSTNR